MVEQNLTAPPRSPHLVCISHKDLSLDDDDDDARKRGLRETGLTSRTCSTTITLPASPWPQLASLERRASADRGSSGEIPSFLHSRVPDADRSRRGKHSYNVNKSSPKQLRRANRARLRASPSPAADSDPRTHARASEGAGGGRGLGAGGMHGWRRAGGAHGVGGAGLTVSYFIALTLPLLPFAFSVPLLACFLSSETMKLAACSETVKRDPRQTRPSKRGRDPPRRTLACLHAEAHKPHLAP